MHHNLDTISSSLNPGCRAGRDPALKFGLLEYSVKLWKGPDRPDENSSEIDEVPARAIPVFLDEVVRVKPLVALSLNLVFVSLERY